MKKHLSEGVMIKWLGHAFFEVKGPDAQTIAFDPFFKSNPSFPKTELTRVTSRATFQYILLTHPHSDHFEGVIPLLKGDSALKLVCQFEIAEWLASSGVKEEQLIGMNTGGTVALGETKVTMTQAVHTSSYKDAGKNVSLGSPCGYVLRFNNGFTLYNSGDTAVTMDMQIVHDLYHPDLVILPIGDFYTMGPEQAAYALKLLKPRFAIGGHYGTWDGKPPGRPEAWIAEMARYPEVKTEIFKLSPGDEIS